MASLAAHNEILGLPQPGKASRVPERCNIDITLLFHRGVSTNGPIYIAVQPEI